MSQEPFGQQSGQTNGPGLSGAQATGQGNVDAAKVRLISAICQGFWPPLRSIVAHAELLAEGGDLRFPGRAVAHAEAILAESEQLSTGLNDAVTLAALVCHTPTPPNDSRPPGLR